MSKKAKLTFKCPECDKWSEETGHAIMNRCKFVCEHCSKTTVVLLLTEEQDLICQQALSLNKWWRELP